MNEKTSPFQNYNPFFGLRSIASDAPRPRATLQGKNVYPVSGARSSSVGLVLLVLLTSSASACELEVRASEEFERTQVHSKHERDRVLEEAMDRGFMTLRGRQRVVQIVRQVHKVLLGQDPNPIALMDDGGVSLMFVEPLSQRELVYIVPSDGAAVWAFVESANGTKRDFSIEDDGQHLALARWLQGGEAELPS